MKSKLAAASFMCGVPILFVNTLFVWPLLGRVADREVLATFVALLATATLLGPAASLGLTGPLLTPSSTQFHAVVAQIAARTTQVLSVVIALLLSALVLIPAFVAGLVVALATGLLLLVSTQLRVERRPRAFLWLTATSQTGALLTVALLLNFGWSLRGVSAAYALIVTVAAVVVLRPRTSFTSYTGSLTYSVAKFAFASGIANTTYLLIPQGARIAVSEIGTSSDVLVFQYASLISIGALSVLSTIAGHFGAQVALLGADAKPAVLRRNAALLSGVGCAAMIGIITFVALGANRWLPPGVDAAEWRTTTFILVPSVLAQAVSDIHSYYIVAIGHPVYLMTINVTSCGAGLIATLGAPSDNAAYGVALGVTTAALTRSGLLLAASHFLHPNMG